MNLGHGRHCRPTEVEILIPLMTNDSALATKVTEALALLGAAEENDGMERQDPAGETGEEMYEAPDFIPLDATPVAAGHGPIPFSFQGTANKQKVTVHGACALADDIDELTNPALVAAIKAIDAHNGVNRATVTGNKAKLKQKLQEAREAVKCEKP